MIGPSKEGGFSWTFVWISLLLVVTCGDSMPTIECPDDKNADTASGSRTATPTLSMPIASIGATVQCDHESRSSFGIGTTDVTCVATDSVGQTNTCVYHVIITDNQSPTISNCPQDVRVYTDMIYSRNQSAEWKPPTTSDNSGQAVTLSSTHESGEMLPVGDTLVTYTATDRAGNINSSCSFHVRVSVKPPINDIFVESNTIQTVDDDNMACLTVVWPDDGTEGKNSYSIYAWKDGDDKPGEAQRIVADADQINTTYVKHRLCNLSPGELYNVAVDRDSTPDDADRRLQHFTAPRPVHILSPTSGSSVNSSFEVSWELASHNVEQYLVEAINQGISKKEYVTKTTDRILLEGYLPGSPCHLIVSAVVGSGDKRLRGNGDIVVQIEPVGVNKLSAYNYTESTIAVAWRVPYSYQNMPLEPFMLFIRPDGADENFKIVSKIIQPWSTFGEEFTGLVPNTIYTIQLLNNVLGLSFSTEQKTRPARVTNVRQTDVQLNAITVEWDPPSEGLVESYEVYISPSPVDGSDAANRIASTSMMAPRYTFSPLRTATEYFIKVVSIYEDMKSVPKTLMVTTGVTQPEAADFTTLIVVTVVLGTFVLVLAIAILITYIQREQNNAPKGREKKGLTNNAANIGNDATNGPSKNYDYGSEYDVPEAPVEHRVKDTNPMPVYENNQPIDARHSPNFMEKRKKIALLPIPRK